MSSLLICIVIFILFMAAGYAGLQVQSNLAPEHKTDATKGVVGQVSGLVTFLLALVLGTLIGVSFAYYSGQRTNLENFSAQILRLDQALAQFGPETKPMRDKLKEGIRKGYDTFWGGGDVDPAALTVERPLANAQAISDYLATLQPKTDAQKAALATAGLYSGMVEQSRLLMSPASGGRASVLVPHRNSGFLDGCAVFRHRPLCRTQRPRLFRVDVRRAVDCLRDLSHPRIRPALDRPVQGAPRRGMLDRPEAEGVPDLPFLARGSSGSRCPRKDGRSPSGRSRSTTGDENGCR